MQLLYFFPNYNNNFYGKFYDDVSVYFYRAAGAILGADYLEVVWKNYIYS